MFIYHQGSYLLFIYLCTLTIHPESLGSLWGCYYCTYYIVAELVKIKVKQKQHLKRT